MPGVMMDTSAQGTMRINGQLMGSYLNCKAVILGFVNKIDPDGKKATLKTVDDPCAYIQVVFEEPANNLEQGVLVEVYGTVLSRTQFKVKSFVQFSSEDAAKLDAENHNQQLAVIIKFHDHINVQPVNEEVETVLANPSTEFTIDWGVANGDMTQDLQQEF